MRACRTYSATLLYFVLSLISDFHVADCADSLHTHLRNLLFNAIVLPLNLVSSILLPLDRAQHSANQSYFNLPQPALDHS